MAQLTQSLVDEFKRAIGVGQRRAPYTVHEFEQLCWAWEELQRLRAAPAYIDTDDAAIEAAYRRLDLSIVPHAFRPSIAFLAGWRAAVSSAKGAPQDVPREPESST